MAREQGVIDASDNRFFDQDMALNLADEPLKDFSVAGSRGSFLRNCSVAYGADSSRITDVGSDVEERIPPSSEPVVT